jgi:energy-coupling factor transporter ATP-binding protein EcfA2
LGVGGLANVYWSDRTTLQDQTGSQVQVLVENLLEAASTLAQTFYVGAFRNALNLGAMPEYYDISTGQAFISAWRQYKTGPTKAASIATNQITEDIRRIFGFEKLEINASADEKTLQVFVNNRPYMLHEVGSGLTQFIIVLVNVALRRPAYVLIDEPELNLHPSLQLDFLTTLASYATEGLLCATHNMGLARAGADWIYAVRRLGDGESDVSPYEAVPRPSEFLGELGFASYRDLGFDQVLLVEGRSEIKDVQQLLRRYDKDHRLVLLTLGGDTLITADADAALEEVKRLTPHVAALIDSERDRSDGPLPPARAAFVEACQRAEIPCHVLQFRAIENYFPDEAVKQVKGPKYRALGPYEDRHAITPMWTREENWRIARELTREYLDKTDLGQFLASL